MRPTAGKAYIHTYVRACVHTHTRTYINTYTHFVDPSSVCDSMNVKIVKKIILVVMHNLVVIENVDNYHKYLQYKIQTITIVRFKIKVKIQFNYLTTIRFYNIQNIIRYKIRIYHLIISKKEKNIIIKSC
jgi:hypothetical protein